jgi:tetratricopeptide (TPR) repeat protein
VARALVPAVHGSWRRGQRQVEAGCAWCGFLEERGQRGLLSTFAPMLGRSLCVLGRHEEAEPQAELGRELGDEHDVATQALRRQVQARVDPHRGLHTEAEALAREAVALIERTDDLNFQGAALADLGEVLIGADRAEEAAAALAQALERYERKRTAPPPPRSAPASWRCAQRRSRSEQARHERRQPARPA